MSGDPGPRDRPEVDPDVEAVRLRRRAVRGDGTAGPLPDVRHFVRREVVELTDVTVRSDHQMSGVVREKVEDHECELSAPDDASPLVPVRTRGGLAEETGIVNPGPF